MASAALRWKTTGAAWLGPLLLIFWISGNSALECYTATTTHTKNDSGTSHEASSQKRCSGAENACVEVQLKLIIDRNTVLVNHRGCAKWDSESSSESATSGNRHFRIEYNATYCLHDLCNVQTSPANISTTPVEEQEPETTNSLYCYSGFNFDPREPLLDPVRCHEGYDKCSQSMGSILIGTPERFTGILIFIRTCQNATCAVPFGVPFTGVTVEIHRDSCCSGSLCNQRLPPPSAAPTNGSAARHSAHSSNASAAPDTHGSVRRWDTKPISPTLDVDHDTGGDRWGDAAFPGGRLLQAASPELSTIRPCLLLITLGIAILGMW